jgi:hypothetical protein
MAQRENPLYSITIKEIARICHVNLTTARRWKRGARCPPKSALLLICGDLIAFDREWRGWRVREGKLISPEGWEITVGDVLALPLMRQQLAAYQTELKRIQGELLLTQEQPVPSAWPEWIFEMSA